MNATILSGEIELRKIKPEDGGFCHNDVSRGGDCFDPPVVEITMGSQYVYFCDSCARSFAGSIIRTVGRFREI